MSLMEHWPLSKSNPEDTDASFILFINFKVKAPILA